MIKGDKIYLTELDRANAETIRAWLNDPEVHRYLLVGHVPITKEEEERYYDTQAALPTSTTSRSTWLPTVATSATSASRTSSLVHRHGEIGLVDRLQAGLGQGLRRRRHRHLPALRLPHPGAAQRPHRHRGAARAGAGAVRPTRLRPDRTRARAHLPRRPLRRPRGLRHARLGVPDATARPGSDLSRRSAAPPSPATGNSGQPAVGDGGGLELERPPPATHCTPPTGALQTFSAGRRLPPRPVAPTGSSEVDRPQAGVELGPPHLGDDRFLAVEVRHSLEHVHRPLELGVLREGRDPLLAGLGHVVFGQLLGGRAGDGVGVGPVRVPQALGGEIPALGGPIASSAWGKTRASPTVTIFGRKPSSADCLQKSMKSAAVMAPQQISHPSR